MLVENIEKSELIYSLIGIDQDVCNSNPAVVVERLKELLLTVDGHFFASLQPNPSLLNQSEKYNWIATYSSLQKLYKLSLGYYREYFGGISASSKVDISAIAKDNDRHEEKKLVVLVLGIALENECVERDLLAKHKDARLIVDEIKSHTQKIKQEKVIPPQPPVLLEYQAPSVSPVSDQLWKLQGRKETTTFSFLLQENALLKEKLNQIQEHAETEIAQLRSVVLQLSRDNKDLHIEREHLLKKLDDDCRPINFEGTGESETSMNADTMTMKLQKELEESHRREIRLLMSSWYELGLNVLSTGKKSNESSTTKKMSWLARQRDLLAARSHQILHQFSSDSI